jgi:tetratricopeptide (TPR) repeat protein
MSVSVGEAAALRGDPRFKQAFGHMQSGEWDEAIRCLEPLAAEYPDDPTIQEWIEDLRFKAGLDAATQAKGKRWVIPWRAIVLRGLIVVVIGTLGFVAVRMVQTQFLPVWERTRQEQHLGELLDQGVNAIAEGRLDLAAGDFEAAASKFAIAEGPLLTVVAATPDHPQAVAGLARVEEERELDRLCKEANEYLAENEYEQGLANLVAIMEDSWNRDRCNAWERSVNISHKLGREVLWERAMALLDEGRVVAAIRELELIKSIDRTWKRDEISKLLVELYTGLGRDLVEAKPASAEALDTALDTAIEYFRLALEHDPTAQEPAIEMEFAQLFLAGRKAANERRLDDAIAALQELQDRRPGYLDNQGALILYDVRVARAEGHERVGEWFSAYEQCRQAADLPVEDTSWARECMVRTIERATPTLTPTATNTPTPTSTPEPTATPRMPTAVPGPLHIRRPYVWFHERHAIPGSNEWEGYLGIFYEGGAAPLRFAIEGQPPQGDNYIYIHWQKCRPIPITLHVWSSDGQEAHETVQLPGWCP